MRRLSEVRLADFVDEIAAAIRSGTSLSDWMSRLRETQWGWMPRAAKEFSEKIDRGNPAAAALASMHPIFGPQAAAAMELAERSGDSSLLNRLADHLRLRHQLRRESRIAWVYPLALLWVGFCVVVLPFTPMFQPRNPLGKVGPIVMPPVAEQTAELIRQNVLGIAVALAAMTIGVLLWQWLLSPRLSRNARRQLLCASLADQIELGVKDQDAIRHAACLADERSLASDPPTTFADPSMQQWVAEAQLPIVAEDTQANLVAAFRSLATQYQYRTRRSGYVWARVVPRLATVVIGGGLVLGYAIWVIVPIYREML